MDRLPEQIEVDGLLLRRWRVEDAEALDAAVTASADHLRPWMRWMAGEPMSLDRRRELIAGWERDWEAGGDVLLGVFRDGAVAGSCGLHRRRGPRALEIGYWTHVDFLRQGVATRVARALADTALALPDVDWVEVHHDKANEGSAAVARAAGFEPAGESPDTPEAPAEIGIDCAWRLEHR